MAEKEEYLYIPGHVPVKKVAELLGFSEDRVHHLIQEGRLSARKVGGRYMIPQQAVENFTRSPHGRVRTKPTQWRTYRSGANVRGMEIRVQIRAGQQEQLAQKILAMRENQQHLFPGTMHRYMFTDETHAATLILLLVWKNTDLPDETTIAHELDSFKVEFADVLDWGTAQYSTLDASAYT